jgi:hypothetical protein
MQITVKPKGILFKVLMLMSCPFSQMIADRSPNEIGIGNMIIVIKEVRA